MISKTKCSYMKKKLSTSTYLYQKTLIEEKNKKIHSFEVKNKKMHT